MIKKNKGKEIVFSSFDDKFNRKVIEKLPIHILLIPLGERRDYSKQRNSGFNEVMARIASKNKIQIGIDLDELINSNYKEKLISRLRQNIKLCAKRRIKMQFIVGKQKRELILLKSLGLVLGMPTWMTKNLEI